jgi:ADP-heptose:LPS heptosyltransferase
MIERVWSPLLGPPAEVPIDQAREKLARARRVLLVRVEGSVSELLAATPVVANLRAYLPEARFTFLAGAANADAVRDHPELESVVSAPRRGASLPAAALLVARKLGPEPPDAALVLSTASPHPLGLAAARRGGASFLAGFDDSPHGTSWARLAYDCVIPVPEEPRVHAVDVHLSLIEALGVPIVERRHLLGVTPEQRARGRALLEEAGLDPSRPVLGVYPGGFPRSPRRQWPPSHYAVILQRAAKELGYQPVLLGRSTDRDTLEQVRSLGRTPVPSLLDLPFPDRKGVMASLRYFVSHDGEPVHVAAGIGVPSFFVFLSTPAWRWAPYGSHVSVWEESGEIPGAALVWKRMVPLLEAASGRNAPA